MRISDWSSDVCSSDLISCLDAPMMNLAEYRTKSASLADYLPWVALVAEGVVLNKDGSFQRTARFRGPDLDSATPAALVSVTARLQHALSSEERRVGKESGRTWRYRWARYD